MTCASRIASAGTRSARPYPAPCWRPSPACSETRRLHARPKPAIEHAAQDRVVEQPHQDPQGLRGRPPAHARRRGPRRSRARHRAAVPEPGTRRASPELRVPQGGRAAHPRVYPRARSAPGSRHPRDGEKVELYNLTEDGRAVGNGFLVARYVNGARANTLRKFGSERGGEAVANRPRFPMGSSRTSPGVGEATLQSLDDDVGGKVTADRRRVGDELAKLVEEKLVSVRHDQRLGLNLYSAAGAPPEPAPGDDRRSRKRPRSAPKPRPPEPSPRARRRSTTAATWAWASARSR